MGLSVAMHDDVIAATSGHTRGYVYVFQREQGRWRQAAKIFALAPSMAFPSVTMPDADTIVHDGSIQDTFVYRRVQTDVWQVKQTLGPTQAGWRISSAGDVLIVPSPNSTVDGVKLAGEAYVFERDPTR